MRRRTGRPIGGPNTSGSLAIPWLLKPLRDRLDRWTGLWANPEKNFPYRYIVMRCEGHLSVRKPTPTMVQHPSRCEDTKTDLAGSGPESTRALRPDRRPSQEETPATPDYRSSRCVARFGPTTPTRARRPFDAPVDPTEAGYRCVVIADVCRHRAPPAPLSATAKTATCRSRVTGDFRGIRQEQVPSATSRVAVHWRR
jgi:hypothetical protein